MVSVTGPTCPSCVRVRRGAPSERGGSSLGLEHLVSRRSLPGVLRSWTRAGSHRLPGDPAHAFALLKHHARAINASPVAPFPTPHPVPQRRSPPHVLHLIAHTGPH